MAADCSKKEEKRILYDLDIPYEWPETVLILNENDHQSLYKILTAALNACSWFALAVLKSPTRLLGLSSQPPSVLSDLLNSRLSWQLVLSSDGRQLAVVQESVIEIRSILDDFSTARASVKVSSDPYPQWRYSVWSPQGTSLAYANSQGHITVYSYNGEVLYQLSETGGGIALSGNGSERLTPFLMTALSGMCFASSSTDSGSTLLIVMSYEAQITTYCLKQNKSYIVLHSLSLLDYFPYGAGGIQYLSDSNLIVIAGWSDAKESPLVSCWRLVNDSPYWIPAADNQIKKSKRGTFQSLVNKKIFNDDWVYSVSLSPSGSLLATLSLSGCICLWDLPSCRLKSKWLPEELPGSNESHMVSTSFGFETTASKDFGMAQLLKDNDHGASFRGSPLYMAPEVMLGKTYDAKVDLWSIGVILFEILYGFAPYHSSTIKELHLRVLDDSPITIPPVPETSSKYKEVLQGLLERDPCQRIYFEEFFDHSYIDLEHMPGPDCLSKARELVKQAVVKDGDGKYSSAVNYYCQALEYFVPALDYEEDYRTRESLKDMIEQYIARAEYLKSLVGTQRPSLRDTAGENRKRILDEMQAELPQLKDVHSLIEQADQLEERRSYHSAREVYKEAVSILLPLIEKADSPEKKLIASEVQVFLQRGEELTVLLEKKVPSYHRSSSFPSSASGLKSTINESRHVYHRHTHINMSVC